MSANEEVILQKTSEEKFNKKISLKYNIASQEISHDFIFGFAMYDSSTCIFNAQSYVRRNKKYLRFQNKCVVAISGLHLLVLL